MRVSTSAINTALLNNVTSIQERVTQTNLQLSTEKKSQDYQGVSADARILIKSETTVAVTERYLSNNGILASQLDVGQSALSAAETTIEEFYSQLLTYDQNAPTEESTAAIQDAAFRALLDLQDYLNTDFSGTSLFAGTKTESNAVDFPYGSLEDFQDVYDGVAVHYPIYADANLADVSTTNAETGDLTLTANTITAATAGSLSNIPVGATITLNGSTLDDGTYTVVANDGTTISISGTIASTDIDVVASMDSNGNETVAATLSTTTYYTGDNGDQTYRIDNDNDVVFDFSAADPAIEKAIRGIALIAQGGGFGEAGSLDQNMHLVEDAKALISDALNEDSAAQPPFGDEQAGSIDRMMADLGYDQRRLADRIQQQETEIALLEGFIAELENADLVEASVRLQDDLNALEVTYAVIADMQNLSLSNYL